MTKKRWLTMNTNEKKPSKTSSVASRLNVLYIILVLKNYSSPKKPMSIKEITEKVNSDYYHTFSDEDSINHSTVSRILDALCADVSLGMQNIPMAFYDDDSNLGFNILCVMETDEGDWDFYKAPNTGKGPKKYYYYDSVFTNAELATLIDSVEAYNYFSTEDIAGLVEKLLGLRPTSEFLSKYNESGSARYKDEDSLVLSNIDELKHIIKNKQFAQITYCNYNSKFELEPREKYPRVVKPLTMMWSNGYYYLVAQLGKGYTPANLRLDRITDIVAVNPTKEMIEDYKTDFDFDATSYRMKHPIMYGGKVEHVTLLFLDTPINGMINALVDIFGKTTKIRPATEAEIKNNLSPSILKNAEEGTWMRADFSSTSGGAMLFASQYCRDCKIISPQSLKESVAQNLATGYAMYNE